MQRLQCPGPGNPEDQRLGRSEGRRLPTTREGSKRARARDDCQRTCRGIPGSCGGEMRRNRIGGCKLLFPNSLGAGLFVGPAPHQSGDQHQGPVERAIAVEQGSWAGNECCRFECLNVHSRQRLKTTLTGSLAQYRLTIGAVLCTRPMLQADCGRSFPLEVWSSWMSIDDRHERLAS